MNSRTNVPARRAGNNQPAQRQQTAPASIGGKLGEFRSALESRMSDVALALAGMMEPRQFIELALTAIATISDPDTRAKVLACSTESFTLAVLKAAHAGLRIDGRQSAIIPYGQVATWSPMVKGRRDLIMRAPNVSKVVSRAVRDCDEFDYMQGTEEWIRHKPELSPPQGAKLTHAYAVVTYKDGTQVFVVLNAQRIDTIRKKMSKASNSPAWVNSEAEMWEKCALNRIEQMVDTDPDTARRMAHAMDAEFELGAGAPSGDPGAAVADNIQAQQDGLRDRMLLAKQEEGDRLRAEILRLGQQFDGEVAMAIADEVCAAAGHRSAPLKDGRLALEALEEPVLRKLLERLRAAAPSPTAAPARQEPQEAAGAPPAPATAATPAPEGPPAPTASPKVDELSGRKLGAKIHLVDPRRAADRDHPPVCIGCGSQVGGLQGAKGATPTADFTLYCPDALVAAAEMPPERVPAAVLDAIAATPWGAE